MDKNKKHASPYYWSESENELWKPTQHRISSNCDQQFFEMLRVAVLIVWRLSIKITRTKKLYNYNNSEF